MSLGLCFATGDGVPNDFEAARHWLTLAAEQNLPEAKARWA